MKKSHENGRSMLEMIAVLAIIGVISATGVMGYSKAMYKYQISRTVSMMTEALQDYALFLKRGPENYPNITSPLDVKQYKLMSLCEKDKNDSTACRMPLGRIFPRYTTTDSLETLRYDYYLTLTFDKAQKDACIDFVVQSWNQMVPDRWWRHGSDIRVSSGNDRQGQTGQIVYSTTVNRLNPAGATQVCNAVCPKGTAQCNIVFHFHGERY